MDLEKKASMGDVREWSLSVRHQFGDKEVFDSNYLKHLRAPGKMQMGGFSPVKVSDGMEKPTANTLTVDRTRVPVPTDPRRRSSERGDPTIPAL